MGLVWMRRLAVLARRRWFRAAVAATFLLVHLWAMIDLARERMGAAWNHDPGAAPEFVDPRGPIGHEDPSRWHRLLVSRWDAQHYMDIALRGFDRCPKEDLRNADLDNTALYCAFDYYPAYGLIGRVVSLGGRIPIDYALWSVSLVASFVFLFLWTGPLVVDALGVKSAYLALLLWNAFPTGFTLVTALAEPCVLALILGALVLLGRRQYLLGAVLAGAATGMLVTGAAAGAAFGIALLASVTHDPPKTGAAWAARLLAIALSGWGLLLMAGYYAARYHDPLLYVHAHQQTYAYLDSGNPLQRYEPTFLLRTLSQPGHEGAWIFFCILWLAEGLRRALREFEPVPRAYLYTLTVFAAGIALYQSWPLGFVGMNREWLLVLPLFFAMAKVFERRRVAMWVWLAACVVSYWNVDLCGYLAQQSPSGVCTFIK